MTHEGPPAQRYDLTRRLAAEVLGTAFLLIAVVGSGIMGERLAGGNTAIALLANSAATAGALYVLIEWLGPISGAHFNPLVTIAMAYRGDISRTSALPYIVVQAAAAIAGVAFANLMFELPAITLSQRVRTGPAQFLSEGLATFGLVALIWTCSQSKSAKIAALVAAYIGGAYWFTSSTSFANPTVTIARALTDTFAGIRPADVPLFLIAQACGAGLGVVVMQWLIKPKLNAATGQDTSVVKSPLRQIS